MNVFSATLIFSILVACAPAITARGGNQYIISRGELATRPAANVLDVVAAIRPSWLNDPLAGSGVGGTGSSSPEAYVDGRRLGPLAALRSMAAGEAEKVCYFRPTHAQNRFGLTAQRAVVEVFTRGTDYARREC